jgi:hypothetical protein
MRKANPDIFSAITRAHPWATNDVLETMHSIGLKALHPRVLLLPPKVVGDVAKLPYETQKEIVEHAESPVAREGNHTRSLSQLTRQQSRKVFAAPAGSMPDLEVKETSLGVWELSVIGGTLHARRVSDAIEARKVKVCAKGTAYVRMVR